MGRYPNVAASTIAGSSRSANEYLEFRNRSNFRMLSSLKEDTMRRAYLNPIKMRNYVNPDNPFSAPVLETAYDYEYTFVLPEIAEVFNEPGTPNYKPGGVNVIAGQPYEVNSYPSHTAVYRSRSINYTENVRINAAVEAEQLRSIIGARLITGNGFMSDYDLNSIIISTYQSIIQSIMNNGLSMNKTLQPGEMDAMYKESGSEFANYEKADSFRPWYITNGDVKVIANNYRESERKYEYLLKRNINAGRENDYEQIVKEWIATRIMRTLLIPASQVLYKTEINIISNLFSQARNQFFLELQNPGVSGYAVINDQVLTPIINAVNAFGYDTSYGRFDYNVPINPINPNVIFANGETDPTSTTSTLNALTVAQVEKGYALSLRDIKYRIDNMAVRKVILVTNNTGFRQLMNYIVVNYPTTINRFDVSGVLNNGQFLMNIQNFAVQGAFGGGLRLRDVVFKGMIFDIEVIPDAYYNDAMTNRNLVPNISCTKYKFGTLSPALATALPNLGQDDQPKIGLARIVVPENHIIALQDEIEMVDKKAPNIQQYVYDDFHVHIGLGGGKNMVRTRGDIVIEFNMGVDYHKAGALLTTLELQKY